MTTMNKLGSVLGIAAVLMLGACETMNTQTAQPQSTVPHGSYPGIYPGYGVVQSIDPVAQANTGIGGTGIGIGTIAGAVVGGIVGNQVGSGRGNTAATVVGAAGGAYAGHEIEKRTQHESTASNVTVRMDNGTQQTVTQDTNANIRVGDRVQIENGAVLRY